MAAYINRTISMLSPESGSNHSRGVITNGDGRHFRESSPLQIFVKAKKKINDIFLEINDYVQDASKYVDCRYPDKYLKRGHREAKYDPGPKEKFMEVSKLSGKVGLPSQSHSSTSGPLLCLWFLENFLIKYWNLMKTFSRNLGLRINVK